MVLFQITWLVLECAREMAKDQCEGTIGGFLPKISMVIFIRTIFSISCNIASPSSPHGKVQDFLVDLHSSRYNPYFYDQTLERKIPPDLYLPADNNLISLWYVL